MTAIGTWFGPADRPLCGWWSPPLTPTGAERGSRSGVVVLPPIGYEYWSSHRTLRTIAERLAERGHHVLRFDYDGTGDSAGERWDAQRVAAWRASALAAVAEMRSRGIERITLIGVRLGATLALIIGAEAGAEQIVAWAPVPSGKRFARELKVMGGIPVPDRPGASVFAGLALSAETLAELATLDLGKLASPPAGRVLTVLPPYRPDEITPRLAELGVAAQAVTMDGHCALEVPSEDAVVPLALVDAIADWVGEAPAAPPVTFVPRRQARLREAGREIVETVVDVDGLVGIESHPAGTRPTTAVVFLNSGSEVHIGPARAWVEYTRALAAAGYSTLRVDWSGWGESPDRGHAPGRPYDLHCIGETERIVATLRARGAERVVLAGLCAGAWMAIQVGQRPVVDGVIAINPQLYWEPGDPVEALLSDTRKRRAAIRERDEQLKPWWPLLDVLGVRPAAARWLTGLRRTRTPTLLLFAQGDDGIEHLEMRVARRLRDELRRGFVRVRQIPDIDHQMYRTWRRQEVVSILRRTLDGWEAAAGRARVRPPEASPRVPA